jgi:hypothetical protein
VIVQVVDTALLLPVPNGVAAMVLASLTTENQVMRNVALALVCLCSLRLPANPTMPFH